MGLNYLKKFLIYAKNKPYQNPDGTGTNVFLVEYNSTRCKLLLAKNRRSLAPLLAKIFKFF